MRTTRWLVMMAATALGAALMALTATPAIACGGLFCAQATGPTPPAPVDQGAERIIFVVGDGEVTAHVQIQYAGDPDAFAWVVPVPGVPDFEESDADYFRELDAVTRPQVLLPAPTACAQAVGGGSGSNGCGFGCGGADSAGGFNTSTDANDGGPRGTPPVTVYANDFTENFEFHVVGAQDTATLVAWLNDNGYNVSDNMTPVMDVYNGADMKFLAVKLRAGKGAGDIVPIAMTYASPVPMIPLVLTAVAAQPLMGIQVWIVADAPYAPAFPFQAIDPIADEMVFDAAGTTNYYDWVARAAAEADGRVFVTEFVGIVGAAVLPEGATGTMVSRYYTRLNPEQMLEDPNFVMTTANTGGGRTLDFRARPTLWECTASNVIEDRLPSACAYNYCGLGSSCAVKDREVACLCASGQVAQHIVGPTGEDRVTCVPAKNAYGVTDVAGGAGTSADPCNDYACGEAGSCQLRGGFPTCSCDVGAVALLGADGRLTCETGGSSLQTFGPGAGREARGSERPLPARSSFAFPTWAPFVLAMFWLWRRRVWVVRRDGARG